MEEKIFRDEEDLFLNQVRKFERALLISSFQKNDERIVCEEHLAELELLADTCGIGVIAKEPCLVKKFDASTFITKGKLEQLIELSQSLKADLIILDDEISPAQQRNLQTAFKLPVMDRTEVILEVFAQRAQTKEARLQIELAKVRYEAPRLKRMWTHLSRQQGTGGAGGSGAYLKGEGEKQIEIDRRILKRKIDQLQKEIEEVRVKRDTQRVARGRTGIPVFAIIGYTNAGKSTLLNSLTDAGVLVENKLFATLDTTTRKYTLKNNQDILLVDTVGFIRKLPHLLVAAFRSTLEEAFEADILLHLIDASHPLAEEQAQTSYEVLQELNVSHKPIITVLNKIDQCENNSKINRLRFSYPRNVQISALNKIGFDELQEIMIQELSRQRREVILKIPQSDYAIVSEVMRSGHLITQSYDENDVIIRAEISIILANKFKKYLIEDVKNEA